MLLGVLSGCSGTAAVAPAPFNEEFDKKSPASFTAAENDRYILKWEKEEKRIVFYDKEKDIPWSYQPYESFEKKFDADGFEITNHPQILSPISITYRDTLKFVTDSVLGYNGSIRKNNFEVSKIDNGISVTYHFEKEQFSISVDYTLRDDSLLMTVDPKKITEGEAYKLISVSLAPFFCSIPNKTEDSYLFIPSGSGTLVYADYESEDVINITEEMYGTDARRPSDNTFKTYTSNARLPVYGMKNGNMGVAAIIEEGAEAALISVRSGNKNIGYSAVSADFELRSYDVLPLANGTGTRLLYSEEYTSNPISIGFYPLYDGDADYSGIAQTYKAYLKKQGAYKSVKEESILNLQMLGGTTVTQSVMGVPYDTVFATTTVLQAQLMIEELTKATGVKSAVQLSGFGENGLEIGKIAGNFKLNKAIGSKKDMKALAAYCQQNGVQLYMDYDTVQFKKNSSAAKKGRGSAKATSGRAITLYYYHMRSGTLNSAGTGWNNSSTFTVVSRALLPEILNKTVKSSKSMGLSGISLSTLGSIAYSDHDYQEYYAKGQMANQVTQEFKKLREQGMSVMVSDANAYAAAQADYVFDVPLKSSRYDIFDVDVPFYQMVFKGSVPMAGTTLTTSGDVQKDILTCVEAGAGLTFALSYNYSNDVIGSSDVRYFGSNYAVVKDLITETVTKHKDYYSAISGAAIIGHEILSDTLRATTFDNGVKVYVNYSSEAATTPAGTVEPMSYIYKTGGEQQ